MENKISTNLNYLLKREKLTQDDFGALFDLKKGVINQYLLQKSNPKIETLIKICEYYSFTLDNLVRKNLSEVHNKNYSIPHQAENIVNEPPEGYGYISLKYVELLENAITDKDKIIKELEVKINPEDRKQA